MERMVRSTFLVSSIVATLAACADSNTAPPPAALAGTPAVASLRPEYDGHGNPNSQHARLVQCERHPTWVGSATIGPNGGQLLVGSSRVIVPPGALNKKVFITATMPAGEFVTIRFEFQPHGLVFKKPAGLILNAAGCDIPAWSSPDIVYLGENGEILERIDSYYSNHWHTVAAPIWHFSGYAIAW
jgi:hypothetical protein